MAGLRWLGCAEYAVPGRSLIDKLIFLRDRGMWLELANDGTKEMREVMSAVGSTGARILSVQAYRLHDLQLPSGDRGEAEAALRHVFETMEMAAGVGAENVVTTAAYGDPGMPNALERCVEIYRELGKAAGDLGVTVSVEPLGRNRTSFIPGLRDVVAFVSRVGSEWVRPMADTMHIHDNGDPVYDVIARHLDLLSEIQLRDTGSLPPGSGKLDFSKIVELLRGYGGLVCLEYTPGRDAESDFAAAVAKVRELISRAQL
jgi:sugar phosphate isomerase/epimerase